MIYILRDVLRYLKSSFITTPLDNTQASPYLQAIKRFKSMTAPDMAVYGSVARIYSLTDTVVEYVEVLDRAIDAVRGRSVFSLTVQEAKEVALSNWYLNKNGEYVEPDEWFTLFINRACELLELFEEDELNPPSSVAMERSRERLLLLVNNLIALSYQGV